MAIPKAQLIWMNGQHVPWDEARVHVLVHALHYGSSVFEGIRAYETSQGPAIFRLAAHLDVTIPMAYFKEDQKPVSWISDVLNMARYRVGDKGLFAGISAYQKPGVWTMTDKQFSESIERAKVGVSGIVFYPYLYMFGRGEQGWNMPKESALALNNIIDRHQGNKPVLQKDSKRLPDRDGVPAAGGTSEGVNGSGRSWPYRFIRANSSSWSSSNHRAGPARNSRVPATRCSAVVYLIASSARSATGAILPSR